MRKFYNLFLILFLVSSFSFGQKVLNTPTAENSTITDPLSITMTPGFSVKSVSGSKFRAFIDSNGNGIPDNQEAEFPTLNENFVRTIECLDAACSKKKETVVYFDGLGREKQALQVAASPTGKTIITPFEYDGFGRQEKEFLPFPISSSDNKISSQKNGASFYHNLVGDSIAYSQKTFENSPLNRILFQAAPGNSWKKGSDHEIGFSYKSNTNNEVLRFDVSLNASLVPTLVANGSYTAGKLYKTVTTDENKQPIEEFKDQEGRIILKRIDIPKKGDINSSGRHDTYYVYDVYGNLTYVLPPKLIEVGNYNANLAELGYQYQYDEKNRLVEKQLPGKGREFMVYDNQDRLVGSQDAEQRKTNTYTFIQYDKFGRLAIQGQQQETRTSRKDIQDYVNGLGLNNVERTTNSYPRSEIDIFYTRTAYGGDKPTTIYYYDNYENLTTPSAINNQQVIGLSDTKTKGLAVATFTNVLGTTTWNKSYTFYDTEHVRPIASRSDNYLGGYTNSASTLDFRGKVLSTVTKHKLDNGASSEITVKETFDYYDNELLKSQKHQINNGPVEYIAQNSYNEINQLVSKKVGNDNASTPLQNVAYKYNIRGWMTDINNVDNNNSLFAFHLNYDKLTRTTNNTNVKALHNGNISETIWRTDINTRSYSYEYDGLNRLINSHYIKDRNGFEKIVDAYNEKIDGYDKNGNILGIQRIGGNEILNNPPIDELTYTYQNHSNKLLAVTDDRPEPAGFDDKNKTGNDYDYDLNGNLIKDLNKEITKITYNHLNLPTEVLWNASRKINYLYDASGVKLRKIVTDGTTINTTDYISGFQYKNNSLQFFPTAEGYVNVTNGNAFNYVYNYTDHLGNVRLSYQKETNGTLKILEENNYYPFGLKHKGYGGGKLGNQNYNYKYNGKELQDELGLNWHDYGWRNYDAAIGRWLIPDPLFNDLRTSIDFNQVRGDEIDMLEAIANKMEVGNGVFNPNNLNPYSYGYNNPISFRDPDGRCPMCWGALAGAGLELGGQLLAGTPINKIDWFDVGVEAVKGAAVTSGIGASSIATIEAVATGLKASVDISHAEGVRIVTNKKSISEFAFDATADVVLGKMGDAGSKSLNKMADNLVSSASKTEVKTAKSLTKANNVFNKVTDGGKNLMGSKSVAATSNLVNAQSNMLKAKGHTAAAKLFQTSTKNGTVINNAIQNKTSENVKKVFGL